MKRIVLISLISLFIFSFCLQIAAASSIEFLATNVYWEDTNKLAVEGYFCNDSDRAVIGLNYFGLGIYYFNDIDKTYYTLGEGVWENGEPYAGEKAYNLNAYSCEIPITEAYIYPGQNSYWKFILPTDKMPSFTIWQPAFEIGCDLVE